MEISRTDLEKRHESGSGWFTTIAALSGINILILFMEWNINFPAGLGLSSFAAAFLMQKTDTNTLIMPLIGLTLLFISFAIIGIFIYCKVQSKKMKPWAYVLGMSIYAFDALICLLLKDWISFGFHAWGLYSLWLGYSACKQLLLLATAPTEVAPESEAPVELAPSES